MRAMLVHLEPYRRTKMKLPDRRFLGQVLFHCGQLTNIDGIWFYELWSGFKIMPGLYWLGKESHWVCVFDFQIYPICRWSFFQ